MRGHQSLVPDDGTMARGLSSPQLRPDSISSTSCLLLPTGPCAQPQWERDREQISILSFPVQIQVARLGPIAFIHSAVCRLCVAEA